MDDVMLRTETNIKNCAFLLNIINHTNGVNEKIDINDVWFTEISIKRPTNGFEYNVLSRMLWYVTNGYIFRKDNVSIYRRTINERNERGLDCFYTNENGQYHKLDGPSHVFWNIDYDYYTPSFYLNNKKISEKLFWQEPEVIQNMITKILTL